MAKTQRRTSTSLAKLASKVLKSKSSSKEIQQNDFHKHFTEPYRLKEYGVVLQMLQTFDVISHNTRSGRVAPAKNFYAFKDLKSLVSTAMNQSNTEIHISKSQVGNVVGGNQFLEGSPLIATSKSINPIPSKNEMPQNNKIWTISNTGFVIITGVVIGILVLIFWEYIREFVESNT